MSQHPILVLQMQRMGDLVLTFPLLAVLRTRYPGHPVWVVAEERFFTPLFPLSPEAVYFPPTAHPQLRTASFRAVINLSHRHDAAVIAGSVQAEERFGAYITAEGSWIGGYWPLYRASIVHNNRYNLFHWADLHALEHVHTALPRFSPPGNTSRTPSGRVGLFVGASETEKRPSPEFFGQTASLLLRKGLRPLFLGGPDDIALGEAAQSISGIPQSSLCGKLSLPELAEVIKTLDLFVTPDTGPMHLATWVGTPVLNLSLGPVHARETGPFLPGHHVLRPHTSCAGCWQCHLSTFRCHALFQPARVALLIHTLLHAPQRLNSLHLPGLALERTSHDAHGLHDLIPLRPENPSSRLLLGRFWQEWFRARARALPPSPAPYQTLAAAFPPLAEHLHRSMLHLGRAVSRHLARQRHHPCLPLPENFWEKVPPLLRPYSGHMHLRLQNAGYALATWEHILEELGLFE